MQICISTYDIITFAPEKDRAMAMGNMHKNLVKIGLPVFQPVTRADRQTNMLMTLLHNTSVILSGKTVPYCTRLFYYVPAGE